MNTADIFQLWKDNTIAKFKKMSNADVGMIISFAEYYHKKKQEEQKAIEQANEIFNEK